MSRRLPLILEILDKRGVRCALIGAGAMAAHGVARSTADLDFWVMDTEVLSRKFWLQSEEQLAPIDLRDGRSDPHDPLAGVVRFGDEWADDPDVVDLVVGHGSTWGTQIHQRAIEVTFRGMQLSVASAADLILLKLYAGGPMDLRDIDTLLLFRPALGAEVDALMTALPPLFHRLWSSYRAPR